MMLANNVISRATFGKKFDGDDEDGGSTPFEPVLHESQEMFMEFNLADRLPWMKWINRFNGVNSRLDKVCGELDELFEEMIAEHLDPKRRRQVGGEEDMLDLLLRAHKDPNHLNAISMQQVKGILLDMFAAGTDSSAITIIWLMTELIKNPTKMKRAQEEIRAAIKGKQKVEEYDLHKLNYLQAAIKETMRLHPPAPRLVRETISDCTVHGYEIPAGTRVIIDTRAIGTDPDIWEDPGEFRPERFLDSLVDFKGQHFELILFGVGRRICPGISYAIVEVELTTVNLLAQFDWSFPYGMTTEDVDVEEVFGLLVFKKTPLSLIAKHVDLFNAITQGFIQFMKLKVGRKKNVCNLE